mgnify:CR=1 FL=1
MRILFGILIVVTALPLVLSQLTIPWWLVKVSVAIGTIGFWTLFVALLAIDPIFSCVLIFVGEAYFPALARIEKEVEE